MRPSAIQSPFHHLLGKKVQTNMLKKIYAGAAVAFLAFSGNAFAKLAVVPQAMTQQEISPQRARMLKIIQKIDADPAGRAAVITAGRERSLLCADCHGATGNSVKPGIPNLASQNPAYLLDQIDRFATGRRKNFVMNALASSFTMDDKVNLAIYFSSMPLHPEKYDPVLAAQGKPIFNSVCYLCHGLDGKGGAERGFARIAGQRPSYVILNLKRFRAVARHEVDANDIVRDSPRMEMVTQNLSDADIEALANYVDSLQ